MALVAQSTPPLLSTQLRVFPGNKPAIPPRRVQKARGKAHIAQNELLGTEASPEVESDFIKRFFALPSELRNNVYRQLLVQPCKFDVNHKETCRWEDRVSVVWPGPSLSRTGSCANCARNGYHEPQPDIFKSPFRSKWAKPHTNEYLCDTCYWEVRGRETGDPCMRSFRCLCTRRQNLEVLLINRRFHDEASKIFWSENCFAFEYAHLLTGFLRAIRPHVRSWLRKISFMPAHENIVHDDTTVGEREWGGQYSNHEVDPWGWEDAKSCWYLLRLCDGLTWLELDAYCLHRLSWALLIRLIHVNGQVVFSRRPGDEEINPRRINTNPQIWLSISFRKPVQTPTTEMMIKSMTSSRNMKAQMLKRHYGMTPLHEIYGGDIYPPLDDW